MNTDGLIIDAIRIGSCDSAHFDRCRDCARRLNRIVKALEMIQAKPKTPRKPKAGEVGK